MRSKTFVLWVMVLVAVNGAAFAASWRVTGAKVHIRQEEYEEAIKLLQEEIAESPKNAEAYAFLGKAYVLQGEFMEAAEAWTVAEEIFTEKKKEKKLEEILTDRQYYWNGALNKGLSYFRQAREFAGAEPPPEEGETAEGYLDKAEEAFVATYHIFGAHPKTLFFLGLVYEYEARIYGEHEADEALTVTEYDLATGAPVQRETTAGDYVTQSYKNALNVYEKAVELKRADMAADNWDEKTPFGDYIEKVGTMALRLKDYDRALAVIEPLLEETPDDTGLLSTKAVIHESRNEITEALATYTKMVGLLESGETKADVLFRMGALYLRKGYEGRDPKKAVEVLEQAREISPENPRILIHLGRAYVDIGEIVKGKELLKKGEELYSEGSGGGE